MIRRAPENPEQNRKSTEILTVIACLWRCQPHGRTCQRNCGTVCSEMVGALDTKEEMK